MEEFKSGTYCSYIGYSSPPYPAMRSPLFSYALCAILLCACYALSGSDSDYAPTSSNTAWFEPYVAPVRPTRCPQSSYALSAIILRTARYRPTHFPLSSYALPALTSRALVCYALPTRPSTSYYTVPAIGLRTLRYCAAHATGGVLSC
eukprot:832565-Rhodomonas_salina.2